MSVRKKLFAAAAGLVAVLGVVCALGGIKAAQVGAMIKAGESFRPPPIAVTTTTIGRDQWASTFSAVGSSVAVHQVSVASEVAGAVRALRFESGDAVEAGDVLLTLDTTVERAQLASARAEALLAQSSLLRQQELSGSGAGTPAMLDTAEAQKAQADAAVASILAILQKKTIRAPFAGRLGIRQVDLGQILSPGTPIASLQSLSPIYIEFSLPEQSLASVAKGQKVVATSDVFPDASWEGSVETVNATVDESTRNIRIRALIDNSDERLRPGMFFDVRIVQGDARAVLTLPVTAVLAASYGDSVFVVKSSGGAGAGGATQGEAPELTAQRTFVRLGERRGDFVEVLSGLSGDETVVSTGAFKLQNGAAVTVRNDISPDIALTPNPENR